MNTVIRYSHIRSVRCALNVDAEAEDLEIARQRMRHLASWNIEPLPMMHSLVGTSNDPLTPEQRVRSEQLALQVLAVQMWHTGTTSAMY